MSTPSSSPTCVFCGREIGPDDPVSGRPPMAAHAACADAALADDRHWDDVASYGTDDGADEPSPEPEGVDAASERGRGGGCLSLLAALATLLLALLSLIL